MYSALTLNPKKKKKTLHVKTQIVWNRHLSKFVIAAFIRFSLLISYLHACITHFSWMQELIVYMESREFILLVLLLLIWLFAASYIHVVPFIFLFFVLWAKRFWTKSCIKGERNRDMTMNWVYWNTHIQT